MAFVRDPNPSSKYERDLAGANLFFAPYAFVVAQNPLRMHSLGQRSCSRTLTRHEHVDVFMLTLIYIPDGSVCPRSVVRAAFFDGYYLFIPHLNSLRPSISLGNGVWNK